MASFSGGVARFPFPPQLDYFLRRSGSIARLGDSFFLAMFHSAVTLFVLTISIFLNGVHVYIVYSI